MQRTEQIQQAIGTDVTLGRLIGTGGFAEVYEGNDGRLGRQVAIKVLREDISAPRARERFIREARAAAHIRHPNVLAVFDVGERDGIVWFTMPLVVGESLRTRLDRERRLDPDECTRILSAAAAGLHAAHRGGLVHRDVKPDNILLDGPDRHVLLADFGIAAATIPEGDRLTTEGAVIGTPLYMSPEQAAGESVIDERADVYSLGVVGYEMLAGEPPFSAPNAGALLAKHLTAPVPPLRDRAVGCPSLLAATIERSLEKDPADRWPTADALRQSLEGRVSSSVMSPEPASAATARPPVTPLVALAGAIVLASIAFDAWRGAMLVSPLAVIVALLVGGISAGGSVALSAQQPAGAQVAVLARRLRRARALRAAARALLVGMPKAERSRLGSAELVLDQLLFAAEQASESGNADVVDRAAGALVEIHAAIEGTVSGASSDAAARVRDAVTRHGFASALGA